MGRWKPGVCQAMVILAPVRARVAAKPCARHAAIRACAHTTRSLARTHGLTRARAQAPAALRARSNRQTRLRAHTRRRARAQTHARTGARTTSSAPTASSAETNKQTNKHPNASRHANEPPERASDGANNRCFRRYEPVGNRNGGYWGRPGFCAGQPLPAGLSQARRSACTRSARTGARSAAVPLSTRIVPQYFHSIPVLPRYPHSTPTVPPQGPVQ